MGSLKSRMQRETPVNVVGVVSTPTTRIPRCQASLCARGRVLKNNALTGLQAQELSRFQINVWKRFWPIHLVSIHCNFKVRSQAELIKSEINIGRLCVGADRHGQILVTFQEFRQARNTILLNTLFEHHLAKHAFFFRAMRKDNVFCQVAGNEIVHQFGVSLCRASAAPSHPPECPNREGNAPRLGYEVAWNAPARRPYRKANRSLRVENSMHHGL